MNIAVALLLIFALGVAFYIFRTLASRRVLRRQKERRARAEKTGPRNFGPVKSKRSQMRTDDDPTTVMERITVSKAPAMDPGKKSK